MYGRIPPDQGPISSPSRDGTGGAMPDHAAPPCDPSLLIERNVLLVLFGHRAAVARGHRAAVDRVIDLLLPRHLLLRRLLRRTLLGVGRLAGGVVGCARRCR